MRRYLTALAMAGAMGSAITSPSYAQLGVVLFEENFNTLSLGPSVNEREGTPNFALSTAVATDPNTQPRPNAFTHTPPSGWVVDNNFNNFGNVDLNNPNYFTGTIVGNTGVPNQGSAADGVDEWEGWSFANKVFWASVDDQNRSQFTNAVGTIAVADSDEFDDLGAGRGGQYYKTGLTTAAINVAAYGGMDVTLDLDSSWRPESFDDAHTGNPALAGASVNNQTAIIYAAFDGNAPDPFSGQVDLFDSQAGSPTFKGDMTNEHITKLISIPAGAQNLKLTFAYINAANDWWWGIDNLTLSQGMTQIFSEDFESLTLGPNVNERQALVPTIPKITTSNIDAATTPRPNSFTHTPPAGWNIDNTGINPIAIGDNNRGVFEWEGWSFADRAFWLFAAQGDAASFTKADGPFAIADSDEFADFGGADPGDPPGTGDVTRPMSTVLESPTFSIAGVGAGELMMQFDSCWRPEGTAQAAEITVDYGTGPQVVLRWDSDPNSPNQHGVDASGAPNLNETVLISLNNPAGATTAKVVFKYLNGGNTIAMFGAPSPGETLMNLIRPLFFTFAVVLAPLGAPVACAQSLLGNSFDGVLYDVDADTGAASNPRSTGTGVESLTGITFGPDGTLYGLTTFGGVPANALVAIDPATGALTTIGSTGLFTIAEGDIAFDPTSGRPVWRPERLEQPTTVVYA